jgi:hexosaminidase
MQQILLSILVCILVSCSLETNIEQLNIIPQPQSLKLSQGNFVFHKNTVWQSDTIFENELDYFKSVVELKNTGKSNLVRVVLDTSLKKEEYFLEIGQDTLMITASFPQGAMLAIQTIRQISMLHPTYVPALRIKDYPVFEWRGMLLDCSRHFMDKEFVKRYIDLLALHKMNVLHWHITEDQAWRIAIDSYPRLTEVGAWRKEKDGSIYGGFYTKKEIKEIVDYASQRHVLVVPEIELPGHCQAALSAYPHLSCTGDSISVQTDWGVFKYIFCAANDSVFSFLETVFDEVIEMFPSPYIHIGGDEVPSYRWQNCSKCQARIKEEKLNDEHQLQSYFVDRIANYLKQKNKTIIGWDEVSEGEITQDALIQVWRGIDYGLEAIEKGHFLIMSPTSHCYFDYDLDAIDLEKVYEFNPTPSPEFENKVLGAECNMWTERAPQELIDSKVFPRILAMSEVLWYHGKKDYPSFYQKVQKHYPLLDYYGVDYGYEGVPISTKVTSVNEGFQLELIPSSPDVSISYRLDNLDWQPYSQILFLDKTTNIEAKGFKNNKAYGSLKTTLFKTKSTFKKVNYIQAFHENYPANSALTLTDGQIGSETKFRDGNWQGFYGTDLEVIIDLQTQDSLNQISIGFFQYNLSWILLPKQVELSISNDGLNFQEVKQLTHNISDQKEGKFRYNMTSDFNYSTRYIKVKASNYGTLPDWHPAAGASSWLFVDEIMIQ